MREVYNRYIKTMTELANLVSTKTLIDLVVVPVTGIADVTVKTTGITHGALTDATLEEFIITITEDQAKDFGNQFSIVLGNRLK